jgi:predicted nucleic acid-binding protein
VDDKYADLPIDLADATLVAVAEDRRLSTIFTLDKDFGVYRMNGRKPFTIVP